MSTFAGNAYHPINGAVEKIWEGVSWPCLFLGFVWFIYKGMWGWGVIALVLTSITFGLAWLFFPFFANEQHAQSLLKRGYLNEKQWNERKQTDINPIHSGLHRQTPFSVADELSKLATLKEQGVLSDEEFSKQKSKLLY